MTQSPTAPVEPMAGRRPLVAARGVAASVVGLSVVCFAAMAAWVHDTSDSKPVDLAVLNWLFRHVGTTVQQATLALTDPVLTVGTCIAVSAISLAMRRWDVTALAAVGPFVGLMLESHVLKPLIGRQFRLVGHVSGGEGAYAFPSGHQTGVTSVTVLLTLLVLRSAWSRGVKAAVTAVMVVWTATAALALVRSFYHYFTDTVGGVLLAVAVMLTTALLIDAVIDVVASRLSSPAGPGRTRTARAA